MHTLFETLRFSRGAVMANRVALAPLTNGQSHPDGTLGDDERAWLVRRAAGGFGLVSTCAAHVSRDGQGFEGQLGVWSDHHLAGLTTLARALSEHGALSIVQLYHGGVRSPTALTGTQPWSASVFHEDRKDFEVPRAATEADIARVIHDFRDAAVRAERAGFGGVELHAAHGYLLSQFLSRVMNTRNDAWGGSAEGRARLVREVTRTVRAAVGAGFLLGVRLSLEDAGYARGLDLDESLALARALVDDGVDFVHLSLWDVARMTRKRPDVHPITLARTVLPASLPIMVAGKVWTVADAEAAIARGADIVALGRAAIVNPEWPRDARHDAHVPRRPPLTAAEYGNLAVGARFVNYLRRFDGMVSEG